jgi:DNA-binding transcriptional regulator YdaS (Cro superfamily)
MKEYWDSLTKEQQSTLAGKVGSTPGYLRLVFNGYKKAGFSLAQKLEDATNRAITRGVLRPDIYAPQYQNGVFMKPQKQGVKRGKPKLEV